MNGWNVSCRSFSQQKCCFLVFSRQWAILTLWHDATIKADYLCRVQSRKDFHTWLCVDHYSLPAWPGEVMADNQWLRITAGAVLHLFNSFFYSAFQFLSLLLHMQSLGLQVSFSTFKNMGISKMFPALKRSADGLFTPLNGFTASWWWHWMSHHPPLLSLNKQPFPQTEHWFCFPCLLCSVAFLSEPSMKRTFPVTTQFASNGRREQ